MKPIYAHAAAAVALTFTLAACIPSPRPGPAPTQVPPVTVTPAPGPVASQVPAAAPNWIDRPQTAGSWSYSATRNGTLASFGANGTTLFSLECPTGRDQVVLNRTQSGNLMTIRTETTERSVRTAQTTGGAVARLRPDDALLDAMALTRGRFAVEVPGAAPLYLPAWAEVTRVIEDCR